MEDSSRTQKAQRIRDVIRYIQRFKNAVVVIYLDDEIIDSTLFSSHIRDISLLHEAGLQVLIVPGAHKRIDQVLSSSGLSWKYSKGVRITEPEAMPVIKMAAFDVSNTVMTSLAADHLTAVIGNWVRARGLGVLEGEDFGTAGEIDKIQLEGIRTVLSSGFIPIFPCIGWSAAGKPYNISSIQLAEQIAVHLQADKLFFMLPSVEISSNYFSIPNSIGLSPEGTVPAMNLDELDLFLMKNELLVNSDQKTTNIPLNSTNKHSESKENSVSREKIISLLSLSKTACKAGVSRVHILNGSVDGSLPCEIFSDLGSGTMIYSNNYGGIREMIREDVPAVLTLMQPFVEKGILLPRTEQQLTDQFSDFIVYELDGAIRACAALHAYNDGQMEIAAVAVDETCAHIGIGPKLISFLIEKAKKMNAKSIFILTTQTADWFEQLGFKPDDISSLPQKRKEIWSPDRGSKVMRLELH